MHALARGDHRLGEGRGALAAGAAAAGRYRARPVRGHARHHVSAGEIGAQPLAGLKLMRLDQGAAVAPTPARQPGERTFGFIDGDAGAAEFGRDLPFRQVEMLAAKAIDCRRRKFARAACGFSRVAAHGRTCGRERMPRARSPHRSSSVTSTRSIAGSSRRSSTNAQA